jgi:hypothetical protein
MNRDINAHVHKCELIAEDRISIILINDDRQMLCEVKSVDYEPYEFANVEIARQTAARIRQGHSLTEIAHQFHVSRLDWLGEIKGPVCYEQ